MEIIVYDANEHPAAHPTDTQTDPLSNFHTRRSWSTLEHLLEISSSQISSS